MRIPWHKKPPGEPAIEHCQPLEVEPGGAPRSGEEEGGGGAPPARLPSPPFLEEALDDYA
jgi:hypothetical protein